MKKSRLHLFAFAFAIILGVLFAAVPVAAAPVGKVTSLEGRIDITPAGAKEAVPAAVGTVVNTGDIIRAKSKSKAEVTFTDGNILRVGENSRVRVTNYNPEEGQKNYFNLFRGKTQTVVNNLKKGSTLEVHTPTAICGVRGTIFVSMYINGQSSFVFSRGAGYGYNINRPDRVVEIPTKVMMIVPRPDRLPLLRPASEGEIDQHLKDTTPAKEGEKKEEAKEEEKKQADKGEAKEEKPAKEEAKKEEKKEEAKKGEPAKTDQGQQEAQQEQTTTPQATGAEGQQQQQQTGSTTETTATSPAAPPPADPAMLEQQLAQLQQEQTTQQQQQQAQEQQQQKQQEQVIEPQKDTTPPTITFTSTPPAQSDDDSATIAYSANEKSDFQFRIDNGPWQAGPTSATEGSTKVADLTEGDHTFTVKAADALGNTSEKSYNWKTDYSTGPEVTITPQSAVPVDGGGTDVNVNLASTDTTYRYKLDDGAYQETTDEALTLTGLGAGDHTLSVFGRNDAGKRGRETQQVFRINRYDSLPGKIWLSNDITSQEVKADIAGIADADWGSWRVKADGTGQIPDNWKARAGGYRPDDAALENYYWLSVSSGQASGGTISGDSRFRYLSWSVLGRGEGGSVSGQYGPSSWSIKDEGIGKYGERGMSFASLVGDWNGMEEKTAVLTYARGPEVQFTKVADVNAPVRMELTWQNYEDLDSHAWVTPWPGHPQSNHIFYARKGRDGYNKFRYPSAYLDHDATSAGTEKTLFARLYGGKTYFSVYNWSQYSETDATLKVYERLFRDHGIVDEDSGTLVDTKTGAVTVWRHLYRLDGESDPAAPASLYYADYTGESYPLDNRYVRDSEIKGLLGSDKSVVAGDTTVPVYLLGRYSLNETTKDYNRSWHFDLVPYNYNEGTYLTKDGGTYLGFAGGILRPGGPGGESIEGLLSAVYIDPQGKAGIVKGGFGSGSNPGVLYPGIAMWEAEGGIDRYDLGKESGIDPATLKGQWYFVSPGGSDPKDSWKSSNQCVVRSHFSSWDGNNEIHDSFGAFFDGSPMVNGVSPMTAREDYIDTYLIIMGGSPTAKDSFGAWNWQAHGAYGDPKPNWIVAAKGRIYDKTRMDLFAFGETAWQYHRFTGRVMGHGADGEAGGTYVYAGDVLGTYNDDFSYFNAEGVGTFMETGRYLSMMNSAKATLSALGYPTEETFLDTTQKLDGTMAPDPAKAVNVDALRVFAVSGNIGSILKQGVAQEVSGQTTWKDQAVYPLTGNSDQYPVYGYVSYMYGDGGTWMGELGAMGAFRLQNGGLKQAHWGGYAAGDVTETGFTGTAAGLWVPASYIGEITPYPYTDPGQADPDKNKRAYLWYYEGGEPATEGYLKGLAGAADPTVWPEKAGSDECHSYPYSFPLEAYGVWMPPTGGATLNQGRARIFGSVLYPKNYEESTGGNPVYTTTTGHSFWGYLQGVQDSYNQKNGLSAVFAGVFIDKNGNAGIAQASLGETGRGLDGTTNAFVMFDRGGLLTAVDKAQGTTAASLVNVMGGSDNHQVFTLRGGVTDPQDPTVVGRFYTGTKAEDAYLKIPQDRDFTLDTAWIPDTDRTWGVWKANLFGSSENYQGDHWFGEFINPQGNPKRPAGLLILGDTWQDGNTWGTVAGYWADVTKGSPATGIIAGDLLGVYAYGGPGYYWGQVAAGPFFETGRYLDMTSSANGRSILAYLNIPAVQVATVDLSGSNSQYGLSAAMNDVRFFSYSTGAVPLLWATNDVSGSYTQAQQAGNWVELTSGQVSLKTRLTLLSWLADGQEFWTASIKGSGDAGESVNLKNLEIRGAAAGSIDGGPDSGSFGGTAAGVVNKDYHPPVVTIDTKPKEKTNEDSATFAYSADRSVKTWSYQVDGGAWKDTTSSSVQLSGLPQGSHSFRLKATDYNGNTSEEKSWNWETNYEKPTLTAQPKSAEPKLTEDSATLNIDLVGDKGATVYKGTYEFKLDEGPYEETGDKLAVAVSPGEHVITSRTTDEYGNTSDPVATSFNLTRTQTTGKEMWIGGAGTTTDVEAAFAGIVGESWGGWYLQAHGGGTPSADWYSQAGGNYRGDDTRTYWLIRAEGQAADGSITGTSTADLLKLVRDASGEVLWDASVLGRTNEGQKGSVTGTYTSTWTIEDKGTGIYTEEGLNWYVESLASSTPEYFRRWNDTEKKMDRDPNSDLHGLVGSTQGPWSSPTYLGLGGYKNVNNWRLWAVDVAGDAADGSRFRGGIGGALKGLIASEDRYPLEGLGQVIYIREVDGKYMTGYLNLEDLAGDAYGAIGMWRFTGSLKGPGDEGETQYKPSELDGHLVESDPLKRTIAAQGGSLQGRAWTRTVHLEDQTWKLYRSEMGGTYNGPPVGVNTGGIDMNNGREVNYSLGTIDFQKWEDETGLIKGTMESKQLSWKYQGTVSGSLIGDRNDSGGWEALASGVQRSEKLAFASLVGDWGQDGSIKRRPLLYSRQPIYTQTKVADVTAPIRIEVSPAQGYESYTWIAPPTGGDKNQYFPVFSDNTGLKTYVKTPYPSARYEKGDSYERIRYFLFRKGDNYFSVKAPGGTGGFTVTVYDADDKQIDQRTVSSQSGVSWYNLYRLEAPSDPNAPTSLWVYDEGNGSYTALGDRPIIDYEVVNNDGGIQGILGGTQSLFAGDGKDIPVRLMGSYTGGLEFNRSWHQTLAAYNSDNGRYVTYDQDPGTYFGVLGGTLRPEAEKTEGVFHALIIGADGKAGLFRGSFGKDGTGAIYPHLLIQEEGQPDRRLWEADGSLSRYDLGVASGIDPATLTGPWFQIQNEPSGDSYDFWEGENSYLGRIHASTWDASRQMHAHSGGFLLEGPSYRDSMWARQDYFDLWHLVKDTGANLGVFSWRSLGAYSRQCSADRWIFDAEFEESHKGNSSFSAHLFSFGTFGDEPSLLKGRALGYFGSGAGGLTAIAAGDTVGTYNEGSNDYYYDTFTAVTTGTWLNTQKYLELMGSEAGRAILDGLGYPTQEVALDAVSRDLTGALASKPDQAVTVNGFRIFSTGNNDLIKTFASTGVTSQAPFATEALYPVTGESTDLPVFGVMRGQYENTEDSRWLGSLEGFGVFKKADDTVFQGNFNGVAAGTYGTGFSGTAQGEVFESTLLSRLDTQLRYYQYASGTWSEVKTGPIDGLLGSFNPTAWREVGSYPASLELAMFGVWHGGDNPVHRGHIFRTESYPTNYTDGTTTTTTGHSYWGYLTGIHQVTGGTQDGIEALLTGIFLDKEKKVGFAMGQIGGPEAWSDPYGWGFDWSRQTFAAFPKETGTLLTEIASAATVTAPSLKDSIRTTDYAYRGGVMGGGEDVLGRFFDADNQVVGNPITMAAVGTATAATVDDTNIKGKLGVWSTELYGSYGDDLPTHDHWIGMTQTPASDQPIKLTGANIYGEPWQNGRVAGHVLGHWASLEGASGITFGRLLGTFDPSNYTYQAVMAGGFLETSLYLSLAVSAEGRQTLRDINIPCVQVGNVNLAGQNESLQVTMNDVKFFAFSTGQTPHLWATNSVAGQAKVSNPTGATVDLSGNSGQLSATFTMKNWDTNNNKWLGSVTNGQGRIDTPVIPNPNLQNLRFRGAAAGTINGNSFSGTAAGVVHKAQ